MSSNYQYDYQEGDETPDEYNEIDKQTKRRKPTRECNSRLEELAKPRRWNLLGTWQCHASRFEPERMQAIKDKIQELFSMTPEETEIYFNSIRSKKRKPVDGRLIRGKIKKERMAAKQQANRLFYKLIKKAVKYSYKHAPPLLVTPVLRTISDNVLELLSQIHHVDIPKRSDNDRFSQFLISLADWTAMFVANIYYEIEVDERSDIENMKQLQNNRSYSCSSIKTDDGYKNTDAPEDKMRPPKKENLVDENMEYQTKFIDYDENEEDYNLKEEDEN